VEQSFAKFARQADTVKTLLPDPNAPNVQLEGTSLLPTAPIRIDIPVSVSLVLAANTTLSQGKDLARVVLQEGTQPVKR